MEECLALEDGFVDEMEIGLGSKVEKSRANGFKNMLETAKKQLRAVVANGGGDPFPSLIVTADEVRSRGSFAASQASYLEPDESKVRAGGGARVEEDRRCRALLHGSRGAGDPDGGQGVVPAHCDQ